MILPFTTQKQILGNWCWAAVASSISFYFDPDSIWYQSALAAKLIGAGCSVISSDNSGPAECNVVQDIADALNLTVNIYGNPIKGQLSYNDLVAQINYNAPVCCQIVWIGIDAAHYVTIYGYDGPNITIGDPEAGLCSIAFNDFCNGYRGGVWSMSFCTQSVPTT
jgi:Papain-like cysteine protease AvrRpt2